MIPHQIRDSARDRADEEEQQAVMHGAAAVVARSDRVDVRGDAAEDYQRVDAERDRAEQNQLEHAVVG